MNSALLTAFREACNNRELAGLAASRELDPTGREKLSSVLQDLISQVVKPGFQGVAYSYIAFHYRSSFLPEGRESPNVFSPELEKRLAGLRPASGQTRPSDYEWADTLLDSLLLVYLYIFGRDSSFSENCILRAERGLARDNMGGIDQTAPTSPRLGVALSIRKKGQQLPSFPETVPHMIIPQLYFEALQCEELSKRLTTAVIHALGEKEGTHLCGIGDCRQVERYLQRDAAPGTADFSTLRKRGIEVALYHLQKEDATSEVVKSAQTFYQCVHPEKHEADAPEWAAYTEADRRYFLRVIQACSVFTPLLGETVLVVAFPGYRPRERDDRGKFLGTIEDQDLGVVRNYFTARPRLRDFWSGLSIYSSENLLDRVPLTAVAIKGITMVGAPVRHVPRATRYDLVEKRYGLRGLAGTFKDIIGPTDTGRGVWSILGLVAADCLRNLRHEGSHLAFNLAIGSDVEFRQVLTPIYNVRGTVCSGRTLVDIVTDRHALEDFQRTLRAFTLRNYAFVQGQHRFVCLTPGESVEFRNIADLRDEYQAGTWSEMMGAVLATSGLVVARVTPGGLAKIMVSVQESDGRRPLHVVFQCDANGRWTCPLRSDRDGADILEFQALRLELQGALHEIPRGPEFVDQVMMPAIEALAENPSEGGTIVLLRDSQNLRKFEGRYFKLAEGPISLDFQPDLRIEFVGRETFRRFLVQDGATIINCATGDLLSRAQLLGAPIDAEGESKLAELVNSCGTLKEKMPTWGTRHVSALRFVMSVRFVRDTEPVQSVVISQDGDVHFFSSNASADRVAVAVRLY